MDGNSQMMVEMKEKKGKRRLSFFPPDYLLSLKNFQIKFFLESYNQNGERKKEKNNERFLFWRGKKWK